MFVIFKNNRPAGNKKFFTYEKARQQARKWIRKKWASGWRLFSTNPAIGLDGGYSIRRV